MIASAAKVPGGSRDPQGRKGAAVLRPHKGVARHANRPALEGHRYKGAVGNGYSEWRASMTSMRAARRAGTEEATMAAASRTKAERSMGKAPGIFMSGK
jgi:hypothetical protein